MVIVVQRGDGAREAEVMGYAVKTMVQVEVDESRVTKVVESHNDRCVV